MLNVQYIQNLYFINLLFLFHLGSGEIAVHLKSVDIFSNLNCHQLLDIADTFTLKVFQCGDNIVEAGKPVNYIFYFVEW